MKEREDEYCSDCENLIVDIGVDSKTNRCLAVKGVYHYVDSDSPFGYEDCAYVRNLNKDPTINFCKLFEKKHG